MYVGIFATRRVMRNAVCLHGKSPKNHKIPLKTFSNDKFAFPSVQSGLQ